MTTKKDFDDKWVELMTQQERDKKYVFLAIGSMLLVYTGLLSRSVLLIPIGFIGMVLFGGYLTYQDSKMKRLKSEFHSWKTINISSDKFLFKEIK